MKRASKNYEMSWSEFDANEPLWLNPEKTSPRSVASSSWYTSCSNADDIQPRFMSLQLTDDDTNYDEESKKPWKSKTQLKGRSCTPSKKNYTFSDKQLWEIERANSFLMGQIIRAKPSKTTQLAKSQSAPSITPSAAINRKKKDVEIMRQNSILMNKLQTIARKK